MKREEALLALQFAINQFVIASAGVYCADELPEDATEELTISVRSFVRSSWLI